MLVLDDPDVVEVSAEEAAGWGPSGRQKRKRKQVRLNGEVYFFFVLFGERSWILLSLSLFPSRSCRLLECSVEERKSDARLWWGQRELQCWVVVCDRLMRSGDGHVVTLQGGNIEAWSNRL
jgi:hypothetical protein